MILQGERVRPALARRVRARLGLLIALQCTALPTTFLAAQNGSGTLQLIETIPDAVSHSGWSVAAGSVSQTLPGQSITHFTWSAPPSSIDASGFTVHATVSAQGLGSRIDAKMAASSGDLRVEIDNIEALAEIKESKSSSGEIRFRLPGAVRVGGIYELRIAAGYGPGVTYRYRATSAGDPPRQLTATLDCQGATIVISALPSLNCHILISGWRRNTADPVEVILPNAIDTFGNHANGIQVSAGPGKEDIYNWDEPTHSWGIFVFACPSQQHTGANCYSSVTTPGPVVPPVLIIVRQKGMQVNLRLTLTAVAHGVRPPAVTSTSTESGTNRPGSDYTSFWQDQDFWTVCQQACNADARCKAYTYVRGGLQGKQAHCWLKSAVPPAHSDACCVSGVKVDTTGAASAPAPNTQLTGTRLTYYATSSVGQCQSDCSHNAKCKGFTVIQAGTYNPSDAAMCYLMSDVTGSSPARGYTSGMRDGNQIP